MFKSFGLFFLIFGLSFHSYAIEPVMDHQGMVYFSMSFDAGYENKTDHDFGFRFDRGYVEPGNNMTINQVVDKPAVFNLKLNDQGLKGFELNGIDYANLDYALYGAEGGDAKTSGGKTADTAVPSTTDESEVVEPVQEPVEESELAKTIDNIPLGVWVGAIIGVVALSAGTN